MNFVEAISSCFRNYANFSGRAVRSEYWYWYLFVAIVLIVFGAINGSLYPGPLEMGPFSYVTTAVVLGFPKLVILDQAREWRADLIVVGSHGRKGLEHFLMGSVSEAVARHAACSVEIVRPPKH